MPETVTLRDLRPHEYDAMCALTLAAYAEYESVMGPEAWQELDDAIRSALTVDSVAERIVAERDGRIVGSVHLFPAAHDTYGEFSRPSAAPELRLLAVSRDARGQGVGERLVAECVRRARAAGAPALGLHTSASMGTALRMYLRLGFVRAPEEDFQPAGAELVMGFRLTF